MIAHISGEITEKRVDSVVIDVAGVGYEVHVSQLELETLPPSGTVKLQTYFAVRENAQDLYGFSSNESKRLFELLLGVSGVGPKVAMSIVGLGEPGQIKSAIADSNVAFIQSANGVGKRGAEKVIVELKDKVGATGDDSYLLTSPSQHDDAHAALIALGYSGQQASQALSKVDAQANVEDRIKAALLELSGNA